MQLVLAAGLAIGFAIGAVLGLVFGSAIFWISLYRGARAVHAEGVVCRAEIIARDAVIGARFAGPALVRLSGAFEAQRTPTSDVLGAGIRMQRERTDDPRTGDQDLLFASFESFLTAKRDRAATNVADYLANRYSSVTPWWVPGVGPAILRLAPPAAQPLERGADRVARLDSDLAADRARFLLTVHRGATAIEVAELRLVERLAIDDRPLRESMIRQGRSIRPLGVRNGIRATVYPLSQLARRLRGG